MKQLLIILSLTSFSVFAVPAANVLLNESPIEFKPTSKATAASTPINGFQPANTSNLDSADSSAQDSIKLSRQLDIAKKQAELRKIQNGGQDSTSTSNSGAGAGNSQAQTVVTGVAIDVEGKKFATLQFADGGVLDVTIGAKVGNYIVTDIKMTGVTLRGSSKAKSQTLFLKRSYSLAIKPPQQGANSQMSTSIFSPSPIITRANAGDDNGGTTIPPIVTTH